MLAAEMELLGTSIAASIKPITKEATIIATRLAIK